MYSGAAFPGLSSQSRFTAHSTLAAPIHRVQKISTLTEIAMSKGMNQKREQKRKPAKTLEEKRAAKKAKRTERAAARSL
jgi:hypothetical protein